MAKHEPPVETVDDLLPALSLEAIAAKAGVTRRTLFAARHGQPVSRTTIVRLARLCKVSAARFKAAHAASKG